MADTDTIEHRAFIQTRLRNYALTHLTTDYKTFTEDAVAELISASLTEVSVTDPNSIVIPADPFSLLSHRYGLDTISFYDEKYQTTAEALTIIKCCFKTKIGQTRSERAIGNNDYDAPFPPQPIEPALTMRASCETPRLGEKKSTLPASLQALVNAHSIACVDVQPVDDIILPVNRMLKTTWEIRSEEDIAVRSLLKTTISLLRPVPAYRNLYLDPASRPNIPPLPMIPLEEPPFTPIFSRIHDRPRGTGLVSLKTITDLPTVILPQIEIDDTQSLYEDSMVVVDGWQTFNTSSPPSISSPTSSQEEAEIDELFETSSPDTEPPHFVEMLTASKMEVPQMPRSRRIGGEAGRGKHILAEKSLSNFLIPLLPEAKKHIPDVISGQASSLIGQPSSEVNEIDIFEDDLDTTISRMYACQDLGTFIMSEKIDSKNSLLMDIPTLPSPDIHSIASAHVLPTNMKDLVTASDAESEKAQRFSPWYLQKVKGISALRVALSWVAFTTNTKLPNNLEIARVTTPVDESLFMWSGYTPESLNDRLQALFESCVITGSDEEYVEKDHWISCLEPDRSDLKDANKFEIILTRQERQRLQKSRGRAEKDDDLETDEIMNYESQTEYHSPISSDNPGSRPAKRAKLDEPEVDFCPNGGHAGDYENIQADLEYEVVPIDSHSLALSPAAGPRRSGRYLIPIQTFEESKAHWSDNVLCYEEDIDDRLFLRRSNEWENCDVRDPDFDRVSPCPSLLDDTMVDLIDVGSNAAAEGLTMLNPPEEHGAQAHYYSHEKNDADFYGRQSSTHSDLIHVPEIACHTLGIATFASLRAKKAVAKETLLDIDCTPGPEHEPKFCSPPNIRVAPEEIFDKNTLQICTENFFYPTSLHKYMASLEVLQRQVLVRSLRSQECSVDLVERETLGGCDLIVDPYSAVIFSPIFTLPSQCEALVEKVAQQSWLFTRLLVIFEAYPASHAYKTVDDLASTPYAYTPPILKAIKKFRRDVSIAEACGSKRSGISLQYAFADQVPAAALYTRHFGDLAESLDQTEGAIWGDRAWLDEEYGEDEDNLVSLDGVNRFSAVTILCQVSLQEILDLSPDARVEELGPFVGHDAINSLNADLARRIEEMEISESESSVMVID